MTSANLLKKLLRAYRSGDRAGFEQAALQVITEEERKNHHLLARDLLKIMENGNGGDGSLLSARRGLGRMPKDKERGTLLLDVRRSDRYAQDIILSAELLAQIDLVMRESRQSEVLRTYGLRPRTRLLFAGPPGCGKTLCAEVIAGELQIPILYTRFDAVISSYLGETAANLRKVFDYASSGTWILFFDEFDAIGKSRDDISEHGELKRVVNTFLQLLDGFKSDNLVIAATNHEHMLDPALWRRFDDILYFGRPSEREIADLIELKLRAIRHRGLRVQRFAKRMVGWSHADVERVCYEAIKTSVMAGDDHVAEDILEEAIARQERRVELIKRTTQ